ncbi:hypothetical protein Cgig2_016755 [Carnegiea gigantea]|uniref:Uncharacterized protein n=1 Tax=Carnegiea gigantea TaxID=171969 RepID=A0A9Q1QS63_9CARY|nr:hypothetical protein Cgig2_016755 [Carnegiea gigantea]
MSLDREKRRGNREVASIEVELELIEPTLQELESKMRESLLNWTHMMASGSVKPCGQFSKLLTRKDAICSIFIIEEMRFQKSYRSSACIKKFDCQAEEGAPPQKCGIVCILDSLLDLYMEMFYYSFWKSPFYELPFKVLKILLEYVKRLHIGLSWYTSVDYVVNIIYTACHSNTGHYEDEPGPRTRNALFVDNIRVVDAVIYPFNKS